MTVLVAGTRGDALRVQVSSADVEHLALVGTVSGVVPLAAAARCGSGTSLLLFSPVPPTLQWRAPGSVTPGAAIAIASDGSYLLEDGADRSRWLRVQVFTAWLPSSAAEANVFLGDRYNEVGGGDVGASEAAAGGVDTYTLDLLNVSPDRVKNVKAWLDPSSSGLAISTDGVTWVAPGSEVDASALTWAQIAAGASVTLHVQRTIVAGASPASRVLNLLQFAWDGL